MSIQSSTSAAGEAPRSAPIQHARVSRYELRFVGLFNPGRGYTFPCDAQGHVDLDGLAERARISYFYARSVIGREFRSTVTCVIAESRGDS
jgi:hypothetical protein